MRDLTAKEMTDGPHLRKDVQRNLERVLQAAYELFAERGSNVTMEEVARRAGVGVGTVYRRFPSKEHLFVAVSQAACAETHRCLRQAAEAEADPINKLKVLVHVHYERTEQRAPLIDFSPDPTYQQNCGAGAEQHFYSTLHHLMREVILEGQHQGTMSPGDPDVLAAICLELLHPRALQNLMQTTGGNADEVATLVWTFILRALTTR